MLVFARQLWDMVRPYKFRFFLGLLCGVLSGVFAPALPLAAKVVVQVVFSARSEPPTARPAQNSAAAAATPSAPTDPVGSASTNTSASVTNAGGPELGVLGFKKRSRTADFLSRWLNGIVPSGRPSGWLVVLTIAFIPLVILMRGLLTYLNIYLLAWVGVRAIHDLRARVFEHLMGLSMNFFTRVSTGDLISRFNEVYWLQSAITNYVSVMIRDPITIITLVSVLLVQQTKLTLLTMLVFPICLVPVVVYGRKMRKSTKALQTNAVDLSKLMLDAFTGSRIIRAYNLQSRVVQQFREATRFAVSFGMRLVRAQEIPGPIIELVGALGVALFLVYFAFAAEAGTGPEDLLQFVITVFLIYAPVKSLSRLHNQAVYSKVIADRIHELLAAPNEVVEPVNPRPLQAAGADIRFENVEFRYGDKPVLRGIDITVKAGTVVALVGPSGGGKTTLTNLLLRFYDPQRGRILIGHTDLREVATRDLYAQIGVVTQEVILFNTTVRENIALGRPGSTDQQIEQAARHAHAHEFIMEKPQGYETLVGERGGLLSGGQRQRLAIARALLKNAPILILDEATSSLDTEAERVVQEALEELMEGRTTICIAHRLSTIQRADLIVVIDQGRMVESGRHAELLKKGGLYRKLYEMQFREQVHPAVKPVAVASHA